MCAPPNIESLMCAPPPPHNLKVAPRSLIFAPILYLTEILAIVETDHRVHVLETSRRK